MEGTVAGFLRRNVLGLVAIYIALGGVAFAALAKDSVKSKHIKNGQVKTEDLAAGAVTAAQVDPDQVQLRIGGTCAAGQAISAIAGNGTVTCEVDDSGGDGPPTGPAGGDLAGTYPDPTLAAGAVAGGSDGEVADNTLTGADILESALGIVPNADALDGVSSAGFVQTSSSAGGDLSGPFSNLAIGPDTVGATEVANNLTGADIADVASGADNVNADRVDGRHVCRGEVSSVGTTFTPICSSGTLTIEAVCTPVASTSASATARLDTTTNNSWYVINGATSSTDANFNAGDAPVNLIGVNGTAEGTVSSTITHFHASSETGQLTGSIAARVFAFSSTNASCEFSMDILG